MDENSTESPSKENEGDEQIIAEERSDDSGEKSHSESEQQNNIHNRDNSSHKRSNSKKRSHKSRHRKSSHRSRRSSYSKERSSRRHTSKRRSSHKTRRSQSRSRRTSNSPRSRRHESPYQSKQRSPRRSRSRRRRRTSRSLSKRRHRRRSRSRSRRRHRSSRSRSRRRRYSSRSRSRRRSRERSKDTSPAIPLTASAALLHQQMFQAEQERQKHILQQQMMLANPQLTRIARNIYVGNIPIGIGLNESLLIEFFTAAMKGLGVDTIRPILSIWLSTPGTFCFLELRSVPDTTKCLALLDGLQIAGRPLRFGRPPDYQPPPDHLANFVVGGTDLIVVPIAKDVAAHKNPNANNVFSGISTGNTQVENYVAPATVPDVECPEVALTNESTQSTAESATAKTFAALGIGPPVGTIGLSSSTVSGSKSIITAANINQVIYKDVSPELQAFLRTGSTFFPGVIQAAGVVTDLPSVESLPDDPCPPTKV